MSGAIVIGLLWRLLLLLLGMAGWWHPAECSGSFPSAAEGNRPVSMARFSACRIRCSSTQQPCLRSIAISTGGGGDGASPASVAPPSSSLQIMTANWQCRRVTHASVPSPSLTRPLGSHVTLWILRKVAILDRTVESGTLLTRKAVRGGWLDDDDEEEGDKGSSSGESVL